MLVRPDETPFQQLKRRLCFRIARLPNGLLGVLFDRENGLLALAPMYLLALPGIGLMLRQQRRRLDEPRNDVGGLQHDLQAFPSRGLQQ